MVDGTSCAHKLGKCLKELYTRLQIKDNTLYTMIVSGLSVRGTVYAISYMRAVVQCNSYHLEHLIIRIFDSHLMVQITTKDIYKNHTPVHHTEYYNESKS